MVGVRAGDHLGRGRAERARSIDLLTPGVLLAGHVGANPEALRGAGGAPVDVAREDHGAGGRATCKECPELVALRAVCSHLIALPRSEVGGAHVNVDSGCDTQPPTPLDPRLCFEGAAVCALNGCLGEHRVTEESAAGRLLAR